VAASPFPFLAALRAGGLLALSWWKVFLPLWVASMCLLVVPVIVFVIVREARYNSSRYVM